MATMNIPIFIPHYGCPNGCVFCNQQKISGKDELDDEQSIRRNIEMSLGTSEGRQDIEIAFFGGSFTGLDKDVQRAYLDLGKEYVQKYNLKGIRLSTRPDYITLEILELLKNYPVTSIELGVQSLDEEVLLRSKRNHTLEDVERAVKLIKKTRIELGLQMMIGLPGDTIEKAKRTAERMIEYGADTVRVYPTLVLEDTELATLYRRGEYLPLSLEQAIEWTSTILPLFEKNKIKVIRVGLQSNEGLNSELVLGGPYHPAFKELVMDQIVFSQFVEGYEQLDDLKDKNNVTLHIGSEVLTVFVQDHILTITGNQPIVQRLYGHKRNNFNRISSFLSQKYGVEVQLFLIC